MPNTCTPSIPGYELYEEIGRGGMGVVHRARDPQFDRDVAIKLLTGNVTADSFAATRFRNEARITGQLQHPGIPAVHELGTLADGMPFLAMKLVKGQTLQRLLDKRENPGDDRGTFIAIFEQLCHAVGYAHAHQVIHRDLKPSNIMVGTFGEVQVMDWGLAKAIGANQTSAQESEGDNLSTAAYVSSMIDTPEAGGSATRTGSVLGTPAYMPPEQAGGEIRKLDARSDVFGLGAILCQILTGQPPYLGKDGNDTRIKAVRGELQDAFHRLEACGAEPDLVTICKQCLSFKQEDRPADGQQVANEVARIRTQSEARARQAEQEKATALVREAEQLRRRRQFMMAAAAVAAVLLLGIIGTGIGYFRAEQKAEDERLAKIDADTKRQEAETNLGYAKKGNQLLGSVFEGLDPKANYETIAEFRDALKANLHKAMKELDGSAIGDPLVVAEMQYTLGKSLMSLGEYNQAIIMFERSRATRTSKLGTNHPDTLSSMSALAFGYGSAGKLDLALPLTEETLKLRQAKLGTNHPDTLASMNNLAFNYESAGKLDLALPLYEETLKLKKATQGVDHPDTLMGMNNLASVYQNIGKLDLALPLYEETLKLRKAKLGANHPHTLMSMNNLAVGYRAAGKFALALPLLEEALKIRKARLGADHPDTLLSMINLAGGYRTAGKLDMALSLLEESLKLSKAKLGTQHPNTLSNMYYLAIGYEAAGKLDLALPLKQETLKLSEAQLGADHPTTLTRMENLAEGYWAAGKLNLALPIIEKVIRLRREKLGDEHTDTLHSLGILAHVHRDNENPKKAEPIYLLSLESHRKVLGPNALRTIDIENHLGVCQTLLARFEEAERHLLASRQALQHAKNVPAGWLTIYTDRLVTLYEQWGKLAEQEKWLRARLELTARDADSERIEFAGQLAKLGSNLLLQKKYLDAEKICRESLTLREKTQPDLWSTFNTQSMLGGALLGQKKYDDAEPLLLKGYEGMKAREKSIPKTGGGELRIPQALDRLLQFYTETNKPEEVTKWQAKKDHLPKQEPTKK